MRRDCQCEHQARNVKFDDSVVGIFTENPGIMENVQNAIELLAQKIKNTSTIPSGNYVTIATYERDKAILERTIVGIQTDIENNSELEGLTQDEVDSRIDFKTKYFPKVVDNADGGIENSIIKIIYFQDTWNELVENNKMEAPFFYVNLGLENPGYELTKDSYFPNYMVKENRLSDQEIDTWISEIIDKASEDYSPDFTKRLDQLCDVNKDGKINSKDRDLAQDFYFNSENPATGHTLKKSYLRDWSGFKKFLRDNGIPCDIN